MIRKGEGCHYLTVKKLSPLSRGIASKHHSDSYCLNCLHPIRTKNIAFSLPNTKTLFSFENFGQVELLVH